MQHTSLVYILLLVVFNLVVSTAVLCF